jgi:hypothetical protein
MTIKGCINNSLNYNSTSTPPLTAFAKAMAVENGYGVQVCDATGDATGCQRSVPKII